MKSIMETRSIKLNIKGIPRELELNQRSPVGAVCSQPGYGINTVLIKIIAQFIAQNTDQHVWILNKFDGLADSHPEIINTPHFITCIKTGKNNDYDQVSLKDVLKTCSPKPGDLVLVNDGQYLSEGRGIAKQLVDWCDQHEVFSIVSTQDYPDIMVSIVTGFIITGWKEHLTNKHTSEFDFLKHLPGKYLGLRTLNREYSIFTSKDVK